MANGFWAQVCYALPGSATLIDVDCRPGQTLEEVIRASGVLERHPEIALDAVKTGVYGKLRPLSDLVRDGDRIEIYRPLIADPKESRRRRARHKARNTNGA